MLIFSQMTRCLDILEDYLNSIGYGFLPLVCSFWAFALVLAHGS